MIPWDSYELVLFDFDDTLVDFAAAEIAAIAAVCSSLGREATPPVTARFREINRAAWARHDTGELTREAVFHERFHRFLTELGHASDPAAANATFLATLATEATAYANAVALVEELSRRLTVGIVSNGHGPTQRLRAKLAGIADLVHFSIISDEVGVSKPHRAIFDAAYRASGLPPGRRTLMVGDNLKADVEGALAAGFDACWISHGRSLPAGAAPTYVLTSLADL